MIDTRGLSKIGFYLQMDIICKIVKHKSSWKRDCLGMISVTGFLFQNKTSVCSDKFLLVVSHCHFQQRGATEELAASTGLCWATTATKDHFFTREFTNQIPDINLSEVTGIWELSGLVPTCDAEVLDVHTLWFSVQKNKKKIEKEVERRQLQANVSIVRVGTRPEQ